MLAGSATGCWRAAAREAVVYTALDADYSEPILRDYALQSGVSVLPKFDVESTKTIGLVKSIISESQSRTRCDVFWNNEILNTLRLEKQNLLLPYLSPAGKKIPDEFKAPDGSWHGFAARARVILVNTKILSHGEKPSSLQAFLDPRWKGQCGFAKPLFGTTATHGACLFAEWGESKAKDFFQGALANVAMIAAGNRGVAQAVGAGEWAFGLTDTDDALEEIRAGSPVEIVYPDQGDGEMGTLFIPNTLSIVRGAPHAEEAKRLIDHLLTPQVERRLAMGPSGQIPLLPEVAEELRSQGKLQVKSAFDIRPQRVDWSAALAMWDTAAEYLRATFGA